MSTCNWVHDQIALIILPALYPRLKLNYFKQLKWPDEWITTARDIVRTEYDRKYANRIIDEEMADDPQTDDPAADVSEVSFTLFAAC